MKPRVAIIPPIPPHRCALIPECDDLGQTPAGVGDKTKIGAGCIEPPRLFHHGQKFAFAVRLVEELNFVVVAGRQRGLADHSGVGWNR